MRILAAFLLANSVAASPAAAQPPAVAQQASEPRIAAAPAWVERIAIPEPNPGLRDRPFQMLLSAGQSLYGADHYDHHVEMAFLIQNGQGLQGLGNLVLPWQPDQSELIVHAVQIIRGGTVIDLLANGQRFTVLRRENNLEAATLDGVLTAVMQPEGLAVGDTLHLAFTLRQRAGALPLRAQNFFALPPGASIRRYYLRQLWPESKPMRWRGTGALATPRVRRTSLGTELTASAMDLEIPQPPPLAPARFAFPTTLQITEFQNWAEVGALLASHFARASELDPASPLRARIDQIARANPDPRARLMAALRLVEDEVRYFAMVMGDGNYLPATADQTWSRRFADCKGKVVLLIALLRGLGIEAEPVLVNTVIGDALNERLPQLALFDHMIVRARIDGRSYWLDATRQGDRAVEELASSTFSWGLPVRAAGSDLEQLPLAPPAQPLVERNITYDGSHGFGDRVPVRMEWIYRGDFAEQMRISLSQAGRDEFLRTMRESHADLPGDNDEVTTFDIRDDAADGAFSFVVVGRSRMDWRPLDGASNRFRFDNEVIRWTVSLDRPAGTVQDAPYAFPVPAYLARTDTVILPDGGRGFTIDGRSLDETVGGVRISRRLGIAGGRATARAEFRRLEREVGAAAMRRAEPRLDAIGDDEAYLAGPRAAVLAGAPPAAAGVPGGVVLQTPSTARELVDRGYDRLQTGDLDGAAADFERAASLNPAWSRPLSNHAVVQIHRGKYDEAEALLARAEALDSADFVIPQARGLLNAARNRPVQAVVAFSRSLELEPNNVFTLFRRSEAYLQLGEFDDALADLAAILARQPANASALNAKARIHLWRGEGEEALAAADALIAAQPNSPLALYARGQIRRRLGRAAEASADYAAALAMVDAQIAATPAQASDLRDLKASILADSGRTELAIGEIDAELERRPGDAQLLNSRCWTRATANVQLAEALADCERAVARSPDSASILDSRAFVKLRLGQLDGAIADATAALERVPNMAAPLYVRGLARLRKGERQAGEQDLAAARRRVFDIDATYRDYGLTP